MKRRHGFTLVELMVSMALIIFMMAILSQAFTAALGVFRDLKGQGDLAEKLRATTQILQSDLAANHFDGGRRLSDSNFWVNGPPTQGFFRIWQGSQSIASPPTNLNPPNDVIEGVDPSGIGSYRSTDHFLAFTVNLRGNDIGDFMTASPLGGGAVLGNITLALSGLNIPAFGPPESRYQITTGASSTFNSQWAEVAWFLQPQINPNTGAPDTTFLDPATGSVPVVLYTLYRRQRLLVPDNNWIPAQPAATIANFQDMSCWVNVNNVYFNNPTDVTVPWRRFGMLQPNAGFAVYPAGLLYGTQTYPPSTWPPYAVPATPPPWGTWMPPIVTPPTYPPSPTPPFLPASPNYPTMAQQVGTPASLLGTDIQLNDVVSFDVRVYVPGFSYNGDPFVPLFTIAPSYSSTVNTAFYNAAIPAATSNPAVFDTWSSVDDGIGNNYQTSWNKGGLTSIPMWNGTSGPSIKAIQVTIRIWDFKTSQTRQVTIVQAM